MTSTKDREPPEVIALVLLGGATVAAVAAVVAGLIVFFDNSEFGGPGIGGGRSLGSFGSALRLGGTFGSAAVLSALLAVAALWWQVGVVADRVVDLDADAEAVDHVDDLDLDAAPYLAAFAALERMRGLLLWARAIAVAGAVGALALCVGIVVEASQSGAQIRGGYLATIVLTFGLEATTLATAVAGWLAARSVLDSVAGELVGDATNSASADAEGASRET